MTRPERLDGLDFPRWDLPVIASSLTLTGMARGKSCYAWCRGTDSNRRHGDFQSPALPPELPRHYLRTGYEYSPRLRQGQGV
jgi:hypothetical protein